MPPVDEPEKVNDEKLEEVKKVEGEIVNETDPIKEVKSLSKAGQYAVGQHAAELAKKERRDREAALVDFAEQVNERLKPFGDKKAHEYLRDDATQYYGDDSLENMQRAALVHREWGKGGSKNLEKLSDLFAKMKDVPSEVVADRLERDRIEFKEEQKKASIKARDIVDPNSKLPPCAKQMWANSEKERERLLGGKK